MKRRDFLKQSILGSIGASTIFPGLLNNLSAAPNYYSKHEPFEGIFPIMQTPYRDDESIDAEAMKKQVNFVIAAGGGGMVWPQLASEFYVLSEEERLETAELIVKEARGRCPVIIGVQSTNYWKVSLKLAKHAKAIGADGIISLPPYAGRPTEEKAADYYRALAQTVDLPIFIQNSGGSFGPALATDTIIQLAKEYPTIAYIKEEASPVTHRIGAMVEKGEGLLRGVFSGSWGTTLLNELRRGCRGTMPGSSITDVYAEVFDLFLAGKEKEAQVIFDKVVSLVTFKKNFSVQMEKEILRRRGIFKNSRMRTSPYDITWDKVDQQEFEVLFNNIRPYFRV
jgi:4-hydroxy-tetrahydrodipicolinate synthase